MLPMREFSEMSPEELQRCWNILLNWAKTVRFVPAKHGTSLSEDLKQSLESYVNTEVVSGQFPAANIPVPFNEYDPLIPSKEPDEEDGPSFSHMFSEK